MSYRQFVTELILWAVLCYLFGVASALIVLLP